MSRIIVVGGGLAGMGAALAAADRGAEVVLVERRPHLGGLTSSVVRNGLSFDNGQHVFLRCCTAYRQFLRRIGAEEAVQLQAKLDLPVFAPGGRRSRIGRSSLPAPAHLVASLASYGHLSIGDRARVGRAALGLRRLDPDDPTLDDRTFGEWLSSQGQSQLAIERLWDLIAVPTLNLRASQASLGLAAKVFRLGLLDSADGGDIGWSKVPLQELHHLHGARALEAAGVEVVTGKAVESIALRGQGEFAVGIRGRRLDGDAVIVATPPRTSATLVAPLMTEATPAAAHRAGDAPSPALPTGSPATASTTATTATAATAASLGVSPIVNVHLLLDRRVMDVPMAACVGSPIQFLFDRTRSSGLAAGQCLGISLSAADGYISRPSADLVREFFQALGEIFPAASRARLSDAVVTRERAATFRAAPGSRALRPSERTARPGLYLAGAWCATGWPATMEGALRSGAAAAGAALDDISGGGGRDSRLRRGDPQPRDRAAFHSAPADSDRPPAPYGPDTPGPSDSRRAPSLEEAIS